MHEDDFMFACVVAAILIFVMIVIVLPGAVIAWRLALGFVTVMGIWG